MDNIEEDKLLHLALKHFTHIMSLRSDLNLRVAKRVTFLLRTSFMGFGLIIGAFFVMALILSTHIKHVTTTITTMNTHFTHMNDDMDQMLIAMGSMDKNVNTLPDMVAHINKMYHSVDRMADDMRVIHANMASINHSMGSLSQKVTDMKISFRYLDSSMSTMRNNVNHMSSPMKLFNSFSPLP